MQPEVEIVPSGIENVPKDGVVLFDPIWHNGPLDFTKLSELKVTV